MRLRTVIISMAVLWSVIFLSLLVVFFMWARDPRSQLAGSLLEITSWLLLAVSITLIPLPFIAFITRRKVGVHPA